MKEGENDVVAGGFSPRGLAGAKRYWRKSMRNPGIHYRSGWFFVTSQVARNKCVLGAIAGDCFEPTPLGVAVREAWLALPEKFPEVELDAFQVMPNHFHGIVRIHWRPTNKAQHLGVVMGRFKGGTGYVYGKMKAEGRAPDIGGHLWEFDYWDDMIADERELEAFRKYIRENPSNWTRDRFGACTDHAFGETGLLSAPRIAFVASQEGTVDGLRVKLAWRRKEREKGSGADAPRCDHARGDRGEGVIVSTFTSAQEREVLRRALAKGRKVMAVLPGGIPPEGELPPGLAAACREGRALLLSPQAGGATLTKKAATWCNEYVLRHADEVWVGEISEGGMLRALLGAMGKWRGWG